jgi:hypothetical protein
MLIMLHDKGQPWPEGSHCKNAIVSIVFGEPYQTNWSAACKNTWTAYADKHGFDIVIVTYRIDTSERARSRSLSWQKLLILDQPWAHHYERLVWVDADIVFSKTAPNILNAVPDRRKIGISVGYDQLSAYERQIFVERLVKVSYGDVNAELLWKFFQQNNFKEYGITSESGLMFNAGVMVLSAQEHNGLLLRVYGNEDRGRLYEQPYLSHILISENAYHKISPRFNWGVLELIVLQYPQLLNRATSIDEIKSIMPHLLNELDKAFFLHFAGCPNIFEGYSALVS